MRCQLSPVASKLWKITNNFLSRSSFIIFPFYFVFHIRTEEKKQSCAVHFRPATTRRSITFLCRLLVIFLLVSPRLAAVMSSTSPSLFRLADIFYIYYIEIHTYTCPAISFSPFHLVFSFVSLLSYILSISLSFIALMERHGGRGRVIYWLFIYTGVHNSKSTFRFGPAQVDFPSIDTHLHAGRDGVKCLLYSIVCCRSFNGGNPSFPSHHVHLFFPLLLHSKI